MLHFPDRQVKPEAQSALTVQLPQMPASGVEQSHTSPPTPRLAHWKPPQSALVAHEDTHTLATHWPLAQSDGALHAAQAAAPLEPVEPVEPVPVEPEPVEVDAPVEPVLAVEAVPVEAAPVEAVLVEPVLAVPVEAPPVEVDVALLALLVAVVPALLPEPEALPEALLDALELEAEVLWVPLEPVEALEECEPVLLLALDALEACVLGAVGDLIGGLLQPRPRLTTRVKNTAERRRTKPPGAWDV